MYVRAYRYLPQQPEDWRHVPEAIKGVVGAWKSADDPADPSRLPGWFAAAQHVIGTTSTCYSKAAGNSRELVVEVVISSDVVDSAMRAMLLKDSVTYGRLV